MAGYFQRDGGARCYEGAYTAGEELANGVFVEITADGVEKITATGDTLFRVEEKTTLFGLPALRLVCTVLGDKEVYFTENEFEIYGDGDFDQSAYTVPKGHLVKMRRPIVNDMVIMSVSAETYAALDKGDIVNAVSGGSVAEYVAPSEGGGGSGGGGESGGGGAESGT